MNEISKKCLFSYRTNNVDNVPPEIIILKNYLLTSQFYFLLFQERKNISINNQTFMFVWYNFALIKPFLESYHLQIVSERNIFVEVTMFFSEAAFHRYFIE